MEFSSRLTASIQSASPILKIRFRPAKRRSNPSREIVRETNDAPTPNLQHEFGNRLETGVVEDPRLLNTALGWIECKGKVY